ncbi:DUF3558 domain-containing protein [Nocardia neocaledoniensis]|uniref:DUF3558 domain-containing protein n=1 Tax=Nocardia neocaledoniensis TaxID=236511 RepID=UPI0024563267|nr:DUF3558 domain-containing protein [Nocardia neocaledoniensis]
MKRAGTAVLVAGLAVAGLAGCESGQSSSKGATTTARPALWNPCTEISDDVLRSAGVDPGTEEKGVAGVPQSGWEICGWEGQTYSLTIYTTNKSVADFEQKPGNVDFRDVTIAGRSGREFRVTGASKELDCDVVFPAAQGIVQLQVLNRASLDNLTDPCTTLARVGENLVPIFPR